LVGYRLDLAEDVGVDELAEVNAANVVDDAKIEELQVESTKVEDVEDTELVDLEEGLQRLELEQVGDVKGLGVEQTLELQDVEVVDVGKAVEEINLQGVDVEQVVEVDLAELLELVELADVEASESTLLNLGARGRGSDSQAGKGRDEDGRGLHFCGWVSERLCVRERRIKGLEVRAQLKNVQKGRSEANSEHSSEE